MRNAHWLRGSNVFVAIALAVAAGSCDASGGAADLCKQTIQANCDKIFDCAEGAPARSDAGGSKSACVTDMMIFCAGASSSTCPGGQTYHADKAQQCLDQTKSATCAKSFDSTGFLMSPDACSQLCS